MTTSDTNLLHRPPKLKSDGSGYDWRELDRFLSKIYNLLGLIYHSKSYNIPDEIKDMQTTALLSTYDSIFNDISPAHEEIFKQIIFEAGNYYKENEFTINELLTSTTDRKTEDGITIASLLATSGENPTFENRIKTLESSSVKDPIVTVNDIEVTNAANGIILRDTQASPHKWRVTVSTLGILTVTDLGVA